MHFCIIFMRFFCFFFLTKNCKVFSHSSFSHNNNHLAKFCEMPTVIIQRLHVLFVFGSLGLPIYRGGFPTHNCLDNLLNPRASLPPSAVTRDPFWYDLGDVALAPLRASSYLPPSLRDSYLSPIKRRYLWTRHPRRPFGKIPLKMSTER